MVTPSAAPLIFPPRRPAGPLPWDGPADEVPEEALFAMAHADWPAAHQALWDTLNEFPSDWQYYHLALALQHQGRLQEAEACYRAALEISPDIAEATYNMGCLQLEMGRWSEAIVSFKQVLKRREDFVDALVNLGHVYFHLRMTGEAAKAWGAAARLQPRAKDTAANLRFVRRLLQSERVARRPA
jgi:tetratricopeptide (TPR) repeat protein